MCVTFAKAKLSNTILYGAEVIVHNTLYHVLGYQNKVQNRSSGGNAMIIPVPSIPGAMTKANLLDTSMCPHILEDMVKAITPVSRGATLGTRTKGMPIPKGVEIFEHDIYTVVKADSAVLIPEVLHLVPEEKRPRFSSDWFLAYDIWYPEWTFYLCCFNNKDAARANPLLWYYQPSNTERIFLPALDSHTGDIPDLRAYVQRDHAIVVGSCCDMTYGEEVRYTDTIPPSIKAYLVPEVVGVPSLHGEWPNGDFFYNVNHVRDGRGSKLIMELPPGA